MPRLSYLEIALLEEARQARACAEIAFEAEPVAGGWMCWSGGTAWADSATGLGLAGPVSDADLDGLVEFYVARGVEPRVEVCSYADPSLIRGLVARGFQVQQLEHVLARELPSGEDLRALHPRGWPEGLELAPVRAGDAPTLATYAEVTANAFAPAADRPPGHAELEVARRLAAHPRCSVHLARIDGDPAGACAMEAGPDGASLFGASVVADFRRRGVQTAMLLARLERAREVGAPIATVHSRPGGPTERNAVRLGFSLAYSKVEMARPSTPRAPQ